MSSRGLFLLQKGASYTSSFLYQVHTPPFKKRSMLMPGRINHCIACLGLAVSPWLLRPHRLSPFATPAADMQLPRTTQEWIILPPAVRKLMALLRGPRSLTSLALQKEGLANWLSGLQGPMLSLEVSLGGGGMATAHFPRSSHRAALPPSAGLVFPSTCQTLLRHCLCSACAVNFSLI